MRYIVSVAETGSIAGAARQCRIAQSSILAALDLADNEMGARLFDRRPSRGVSPTPAGERFLSSARRLLNAEAEFERTMDRHNHVTPPILRIGCFEPFGALFMPELLQRFTEGANIAVELYEGEQPQLLSWLEASIVDAIVTYDIGAGLPDDAVPLARVPAHVLMHVNDPMANQGAVHLADLVNSPFVLLDLPQTSAYLLTLFDIAGKRPRIAFKTRSYDAVRAAVACGFGFSILNMRPVGRGSPDSVMLVRRPLVDNLPVPTIMIADRYGTAKPAFLRRLSLLAKSFFEEIGPNAF
ncbi:LysR family transcriptional regulator [Rhizobium gallicum]|uniref:LysR family transcriptional regulator n=1 Tax=Rhizobium gallicum TaxID=56730 RepID=UPI001ABFC3AB|nr:LysR family transcriptional regulator [Rhizobium gallicum]